MKIKMCEVEGCHFTGTRADMEAHQRQATGHHNTLLSTINNALVETIMSDVCTILFLVSEVSIE